METCLRDVFIGSFVFNSVFVNVVRVSLHQNERLLVQLVAMDVCLLATSTFRTFTPEFLGKKKDSTLHCKCDPGIFTFLICPECSMS